MRDVADILKDVRGKIAAACARAGRREDEVEVIAVTKTHGAEVVREAWDAGLSIVGENKVQEAKWKKPASVTGPAWHLIGHLQANKVRDALSLFDFIHSVDSAKLSDRIEKVSEITGALPHVLFEVNVSGERSKSGMRPDEVDACVENLMEKCPRLTLEGFMTMAPFSPNPEDSRPHFRALRELRDATERKFGIALPRLSMGMSGDYVVAVEEGATWVRLGTVLFGERPKYRTSRIAYGACGGGLDSYSGEGPTVRILD